jgi:hypothetical protein
VAGLLNWLRSALRGEVSVADLAARRAAGRAAYALFEEAQADAGADRASRLFKACAWNAFALQTIVDTLLDVDTSVDPRTAGYVPRSTEAFVEDCLELVPIWLGQARVVRLDPGGTLRAGLPAKLPPWRHDEPTRPSELLGLRAAYEELQPWVESELRSTEAPSHQASRLLIEMTTSFDYACSLAAQASSAADRGEARWRLLSALENAFVLGQLLAVPSLADVVDLASRHGDGRPPGLHATWLEIEPGWRCVDCDGALVGVVDRVRGDRNTGEFAGVVVRGGLGAPDLEIGVAAIALIENGLVSLSRSRHELA